MIKEEVTFSRIIGRLETWVSSQGKQIEQLVIKIRGIRSTLDKAKGGWKTLMLVGSLAGVLCGAVAKVIPILNSLPKLF